MFKIFSYIIVLGIRECGSTLYVGLAHAISPTDTNFRLTFGFRQKKVYYLILESDGGPHKKCWKNLGVYLNIQTIKQKLDRI